MIIAYVTIPLAAYRVFTFLLNIVVGIMYTVPNCRAAYDDPRLIGTTPKNFPLLKHEGQRSGISVPANNIVDSIVWDKKLFNVVF